MSQHNKVNNKVDMIQEEIRQIKDLAAKRGVQGINMLEFTDEGLEKKRRELIREMQDQENKE